ncbi:hypothetical protein J5N97_021840 [Dioscorea zingiberensis]|uniref:Uncharacterized protein n=1 Tax=Dioscorea zingiberensis TaxID=325984 RepID=A0A9D5CA22_9LILI|nr:hypothetical protein J5N97_021840 [Dioscorea zingiberensis]
MIRATTGQESAGFYKARLSIRTQENHWSSTLHSTVLRLELSLSGDSRNNGGFEGTANTAKKEEDLGGLLG